MKKIISLMIVVMLLISCVPAAFAVGGSAGISSAEGLPGETVTVYVSYNATDATDVGLQISFGGLVCTNPMGEYTPSAPAGSFAAGSSTETEFTVAIASAKNTEISGSYAIELAIPADAVPGTVYNLSILDGVIGDQDGTTGGSIYGGTVTVLAPVTEPPVTEPPVTEPPVTEPPVTEPPVTEPPVTEPPVTEPPVGPSDDEPKTGDITPHIMMAVATVVTMAAAAVYVFKRKAA